jgi:hypothetical protein
MPANLKEHNFKGASNQTSNELEYIYSMLCSNIDDLLVTIVDPENNTNVLDSAIAISYRKILKKKIAQIFQRVYNIGIVRGIDSMVDAAVAFGEKNKESALV